MARAIESRVGFPVFHNHLVVDLLTTVFPFGSEPFIRLREHLWTAVFADAARAGRSITFTFTPDATVMPGFPARVGRLVEEEGGRVRFVRLRVGVAEQERRIGIPSRSEFHKVTSVETLRRLREDPRAAEQPPVDLEIDTEGTDAQGCATAIVEQFRLEPQRATARYPEP